MGRKKKPAKLKINKSLGFLNGFPQSIFIGLEEKEREFIQKEDIYILCFDFCNWLETLPKGGVSGATILLRKFLREKGILDGE